MQIVSFILRIVGFCIDYMNGFCNFGPADARSAGPVLVPLQ